MSIQPGESTELQVTQQARHRFICGLNWDPIEEGPGIIQKLTAGEKNVVSYDLDLMCLMYNEEGEFVDGVTGKPDETIDESGMVYHSGDDTSGLGHEVDDEVVSVELKELPDYIHHIFFVAEIQSDHEFADVLNPYIRISDAITENDFLVLDLRKGTEHTACIFARVHRQDGKWILHNISEYRVGAYVEDWIEELKKYIP
jgi:stress response protein SCP2